MPVLRSRIPVTERVFFGYEPAYSWVRATRELKNVLESKARAAPRHDSTDTVVCPDLRADNPLGAAHVRRRFLPAADCRAIIDAAEQHGQWETGRHKNYPTPDIPAHKLPAPARARVEAGVVPRIVAFMRRAYRLEDAAADHIKPYDIFVVKYEPSGQSHLDYHRDVSELSFVLTLSDAEDYEGGGTRYLRAGRTVRGGRGDLATHCGKAGTAGPT